MKDPLEMLVVTFKVYKTLHLDKYFYLSSEEEREHFRGAMKEHFMEYRKGSENTSSNSFPS